MVDYRIDFPDTVCGMLRPAQYAEAASASAWNGVGRMDGMDSMDGYTDDSLSKERTSFFFSLPLLDFFFPVHLLGWIYPHPDLCYDIEAAFNMVTIAGDKAATFRFSYGGRRGL